jgi:hypothetical protein
MLRTLAVGPRDFNAVKRIACRMVLRLMRRSGNKISRFVAV